jgi:beta-glucuronidase
MGWAKGLEAPRSIAVPGSWNEQLEDAYAYLDIAARKDYVAGMQVWNFADFRTGQGIIRPGSMNFRGVFTRDRQPKAAAHYLREIWTEPDR